MGSVCTIFRTREPEAHVKNARQTKNSKIKCELCIYKYKKNLNLTIKYFVILAKFFKKLFSGKTNLKNLGTCIENSLKWTNRNYKLIKIFKKIYIYIYIPGFLKIGLLKHVSLSH